MPLIDEHPLLDLRWLVAEFPLALGEMQTPAHFLKLLRVDAETPLVSNDDVRSAIRNLLRHGGFKPTGRSKPASEYLLRAASDGALGPINPAVDVCNIVSLHSGLPISVVDLDRTVGDLRVGLAADDSQYVFNTSGQSIDVSGLLCLHDELGPCANAVKDAQRTKTGPLTTRTLTLIWSSRELSERSDRAVAWYRESLLELGARL